MSRPNLVLIGFMGTGKSTVGRRCAARLEAEFVDSDTMIEQRIGGPITDFFTEHGEAAFRQLESEVISALSKPAGRIIATGGGVVLNPENVARLREGGLVILLTASPDSILRRVGNVRSRPLLSGGANPRARILELWRLRRFAYEGAAHYRVPTTGRQPDAIAEEILTLYRRHLAQTNKEKA